MLLPAGAPIVTFRYIGPVTVPGKGGRPRKWRSDADRVRAYRARHTGADEPATLDVAASDGDELALAREREQALAADLADARRCIRALKSDLARAESRAADFEQQVRTSDHEREQLAAEVAELNERVRMLKSEAWSSPRDESRRPANRAARRAAQRRR
jgi:chromosome segregation ATPase